MLVIVARSSKSNSREQLWSEEKEFGIAERMLNMQENSRSITMNLETNSQKDAIPLYQNDIVSPSVESSTIKSSQSFEDLLAMDSEKVLTNPPKQIMGMINAQGVETSNTPLVQEINGKETQQMKTGNLSDLACFFGCNKPNGLRSLTICLCNSGRISNMISAMKNMANNDTNRDA